MGLKEEFREYWDDRGKYLPLALLVSSMITSNMTGMFIGEELGREVGKINFEENFDRWYEKPLKIVITPGLKLGYYFYDLSHGENEK